jgi:hypothetical protein
MTKEEIYLIKELIKETVKSVVKDTLKEELSKNKDLREVKFLLAKTIKEGFSPTPTSALSNQDLSSIKEKLREAVGADFQKPAKRPVLSMSSEQAANISMNGTLPDFDAPIPTIRKDSVVWKDLKEKIG